MGQQPIWCTDRADEHLRLCADFDLCVDSTFGDDAGKSYTRGHWFNLRDFPSQPICKKPRFSVVSFGNDECVALTSLLTLPTNLAWAIFILCVLVVVFATIGKIMNVRAQAINDKVAGNGDHFPVLLQQIEVEQVEKRHIRDNTRGWKWATRDDVFLPFAHDKYEFRWKCHNSELLQFESVAEF